MSKSGTLPFRGDTVTDAYAARGLALSLNDQHEEAIRELETALQFNPRLFEASYFYARICREQGWFEKAAHLFEEVSQSDPGITRPWFSCLQFIGVSTAFPNTVTLYIARRTQSFFI